MRDIGNAITSMRSIPPVIKQMRWLKKEIQMREAPSLKCLDLPFYPYFYCRLLDPDCLSPLVASWPCLTGSWMWGIRLVM